MSFRQSVSETLYPDSWYLYDSETGEETKQTGATITVYSSYNVPYGGSAIPYRYTSFRFDEDEVLSSSQYYNNYRKVTPSDASPYLYVSNYSPRKIGNFEGHSVLSLAAQLTNNFSNTSDLRSRGGWYLIQGEPLGNFFYYEYGYYPGYFVFFNRFAVILICDNTYTSNSYNGNATVNIVGPNGGNNRPRVTTDWERCDPEIKDILPASGSFVDDLNGFRISWTLDAPASAAGNVFMPTDIQFQWGTTQSLGNTITLTLDPNSPDSYRGVNIPAKTFPTSGTVYWKIRWKSELEDTYWETDVGTYSTTDSEAVVTPSYPVNASIDGEVDNVFTWDYETDTGLPQYAFDFQYSNNDGLSWENLFQHRESTSPSCTVPANTFIAGTGLWKVRGYNTDDVPGEWSETASIIVRAASNPPIISSVTTTPKVTITWQAIGQQAFRLTAKSATESYESGIVFGTRKNYTIPYYFTDGELQITVAIENRFGVWSDDAATAVIIQNTPEGNISLSGSVQDYSAVLSWETNSTFTSYYVLRDGVEIACVTDTSYVDRNICGDAVYWIMGVTENGNYTESETLNLYSAPEHAVVGLVDGGDWIELRVNRGGMPEITETHTEDISYQYYSGRIYPVAYSSIFRERTKTFGFTVWKDAAEKLGDLIGQLVILKDYTGGKIIGVLNNLQLSGYVRRPNVSFDITVIDYSEEVSFDV